MANKKFTDPKYSPASSVTLGTRRDLSSAGPSIIVRAPGVGS